jgi:glycosyltransferase involved in cell wall biosynthesis
MPAYNAGKFISQAINSILCQTFSDFELIIIDDASKDNTWSLITAFDDSRIRKYRNANNLGISLTRNALIELAEGTYVAWLDADDISTFNRLEVQFNFLENNIDYVFIGSSAFVIDVHGNSKGKWEFVDNYDYIKVGLFFKNQFVQSSIMVRSDIIKLIKYDVLAQPVEDYLMWYQLTKHGKATNLEECLVSYRIHPSGATLSRFELNERGVSYVLKHIFGDLDFYVSESEFLIHHSFSFPGHFIFHRTRFYDILKWVKKIEDVLSKKLWADHFFVKRFIFKELIKVMPFFGRFELLITLPMFLFYYGHLVNGFSEIKQVLNRAFIKERVVIKAS